MKERMQILKRESILSEVMWGWNLKTFYDKLTRVRVFYTVFSVTATVRLIGQDSAGDAADPFIGQLSLPSFKKSLKADALLLRKTCGHSSAERMGSREEGEGLSVNPLHSKRKEDNERKQKGCHYQEAHFLSLYYSSLIPGLVKNLSHFLVTLFFAREEQMSEFLQYLQWPQKKRNASLE